MEYRPSCSIEKMAHDQLIFEYVTAKQRADEAYKYVKDIEAEMKRRVEGLFERSRKGEVVFKKEETA